MIILRYWWGNLVGMVRDFSIWRTNPVLPYSKSYFWHFGIKSRKDIRIFIINDAFWGYSFFLHASIYHIFIDSLHSILKAPLGGPDRSQNSRNSQTGLRSLVTRQIKWLCPSKGFTGDPPHPPSKSVRNSNSKTVQNKSVRNTILRVRLGGWGRWGRRPQY